MKFILYTILSFIYAHKIFSAELIYDVYGIQEFEVFELGKERKFLTYDNESIVLTNIGVNGVNECKGIMEIINGNTSSNIMCKYMEENGDVNYTQFFIERGAPQSSVQTFEFIYGTGRWEELVGQKCKGAGSALPEGKYMWKGKCEISDKTLERVKNYVKKQ